MAGFDDLPLTVRRAIAESTCDFDPIPIAAYYYRYGEARVLDKIRRSEGHASTGDNTSRA